MLGDGHRICKRFLEITSFFLYPNTKDSPNPKPDPNPNPIPNSNLYLKRSHRH